MIRVYFGHHKCASQYIKAVFLGATALLGMVPSRVDSLSSELPLGYQAREPYPRLLAEYRARLLTDPAVVLCLTNGDSEAVSLLEQRGEYHGFHVIRDPRDVLVSAYFSHLYSHPIHFDGSWIAEARQQLSALPDIESGLLLEMEYDAPIFAAMGGWNYANPRVYETRYETLIADPLKEFARMLQAVGISTPRLDCAALAALALDLWRRRAQQRPLPERATLPMPVLRRIVAANAFARKAGGRRPGEEDARHHYRKGVAGDWRTYFTPRIIAAFKERYGDLLIGLGYERSRDW
jgi:hypothetical protein